MYIKRPFVMLLSCLKLLYIWGQRRRTGQTDSCTEICTTLTLPDSRAAPNLPSLSRTGARRFTESRSSALFIYKWVRVTNRNISLCTVPVRLTAAGKYTDLLAHWQEQDVRPCVTGDVTLVRQPSRVSAQRTCYCLASRSARVFVAKLVLDSDGLKSNATV